MVISASVPVAPAGADLPEKAMDTNIFSTDWAVSFEQNSQVLKKQFAIGLPTQLSKKLAGKSVNFEQYCQALLKVIPLEKFNNGKLVKLEQLLQISINVVPLEVSNNGKLVKLEQPSQVPVKLIPLEVFNSGRLVSVLLYCQVHWKLTTLEASHNGKLVRKLQPLKQPERLVMPTKKPLDILVILRPIRLLLDWSPNADKVWEL